MADDDVCFAFENIAKQDAQTGMIDQRKFTAMLDVDDDIDVAVGPRLVSDNGAEEREARHATGADLAFVVFQDANGLVAVHAFSLSIAERDGKRPRARP